MEKLKAKAYDCLGNIEYWQSELKKTNQEIAILSQKEQELILNKVEETTPETLDK